MSVGCSQARTNPRRRPAHQSASPLHRRPPNQSPLGQATPGSIPSSLLNHQSSSGTTSNADVWFDRANQNVGVAQDPPVDNDPPFYLDNSPTYGYDQISLPLRPSFTKLVSDGSSSEEYRAVIDDLTIENQRLKKKLSKHERTYSPQFDADKLFEVKIHGLSTDKKRELEETLRRFALSLDDTRVSAANGSAFNQPATLTGSAVKSSSRLSLTRIADSGYGSMSASGQASAAHSNSKSRVADPQEESEARDRNIQSYLSDIPQGLLPHVPVAMTEKQKKKEVVRRLEQIFGGGGAKPGMHQQHLQQQEVSQSAADADRFAMEARGHKSAREGVREARIMDSETEDPMNLASAPHHHALGAADTGATQRRVDGDGVHEQDFAACSSSPAPEQRPTRPLDLDPQRAQIPEENVEYIRHLGFPLSASNPAGPANERPGWMYLNLLINMAQLHTINVTTDFVKHAVSEYSKKLELSNDGRKIRWNGSMDMPMLDNHESSDVSSPNALSGPLSIASRKRGRSAYAESEETLHASVPLTKKPAMSNVLGKSYYRPLFPPKDDSSDSGSDISMSSSESVQSPPILNEHSGESSAFPGASKHKHSGSTITRHDNGPIIFYNNVKFCTDLSGDTPGMVGLHNRPDHQIFSSRPLGASPRATSSVDGSVWACRRPLVSAPVECGTIDNDNSSDLDFDVSRASPKRVTFGEPEEPFHFEVSGIGGIIPADNMAITVLRQHVSNPAAAAPRPISSSRLGKVLPARAIAPRATETLLSAHHIKLPPSALPPPSFAFDDAESSADSESDASEDPESGYSRSLTNQDPSTFAYSAYSNHSPTSAASELDYEEDIEESDDGSLDFLATARAVNPDAIRVKEREYDAQMAERLAEEIPVGSSAATGGGGSGFNTPEADRGDHGSEEVNESRSVSS